MRDWNGETEFDCNKRMRDWLIESGMATEEELSTIDSEAKDYVRKEQKRAWSDYRKTLQVDLEEAIAKLEGVNHHAAEIPLKTLLSTTEPSLKEVYVNVRRVIRELRGVDVLGKDELISWFQEKLKS
ncbi:Uncharacterised protein [Sphingobacterium daejeonense]|nr:Uncharacterised protein [Sphingobacterium daejeonense]